MALTRIYAHYTRLSAKLTDVALLLVRFQLGWSFFLNGTEKIKTIGSKIEFFRSIDIPYPEFNAVFAARAEQIGGFLLAFGLATRLVSPALAFVMVVATIYAHWSDVHGFDDLMTIAPAAPFCLFVFFAATGGGRFSIDRALHFAFHFRASDRSIKIPAGRA